VERIGRKYYRYDRNGNVVIEQDGPIVDAVVPSGGTVRALGEGTYVTDQGWGLGERQEGDGEAGVDRREYRWGEGMEVSRGRNGRSSTGITGITWGVRN
jgi:hypothetical protein